MLSPKEIEQIKEQAFVGVPSNFKNICQIKPLTIYEIISMGSYLYDMKLGLLLLTEVEIAKIIKDKMGIEPKIEEIFPLSYLLQSAERDDMFFLELQNAFSTFIKEDILLLPKMNAIVVGDPSKKRLITNENYGDFQDVLRIQNKKKIKEAPPEDESPIARKFRLKREARDAAKKKQQQKDGSEQKLVDLLEIAETFGIDYKNKTLYAFYGLLQRHQMREKWNQDIQMLCAGADSNKLNTKYWGESLKEE